MSRESRYRVQIRTADDISTVLSYLNWFDDSGIIDLSVVFDANRYCQAS